MWEYCQHLLQQKDLLLLLYSIVRSMEHEVKSLRCIHIDEFRFEIDDVSIRLVEVDQLYDVKCRLFSISNWIERFLKAIFLACSVQLSNVRFGLCPDA